MSKVKPTLKTIAEKTGLSLATVSKALHNASDLRPETRQLVQRVAKQVGYTPNWAGVHLRTGRSFVIAFVLNQDDEIDQFARNMILGITMALRETRYLLTVLPQSLGQDPMEPVAYVVDNSLADGLIITHTEPQDPRAKLLNERDIPFITHGRTELSTPHPFHDYDNFDFTYRATKYLLARGRRNIVLITPPRVYTYYGHQLGGYMRAVYEAGVEPNLPRDVDLSAEPARLNAFARRAARSSTPPDGYICGSENRCLALLAGARAGGADEGRDVDFVAKQTTSLLDYIDPQITSFGEDLKRAGEQLASLLLRRLAGEKADDLQVIDKPTFHGRKPGPT